MHSLRELQQRFAGSLLDDDSGPVLPLIDDHGLPAGERLRIYRNNCRAGFLAPLSAGYPVLQRLTGVEYFRQLVLHYQRCYPSPSGNLFHAGARFPDFLAQRFAGTAFEYFSDVARLEWACQEVLVAAEHGALDLARLAAVSSGDYPKLRFELHPAIRLVKSKYPVARIWEAHQELQEPDPIDISTGGEQALVRRRGDSIAIYRLPPAEYECLAMLHSVRPLAAALEAALATESDFDLRDALQRWAELGFIVDFSVLGESTDE